MILRMPSSLSPDYDNNDLYAVWQWWYAIPSLLLGFAVALYLGGSAKVYRVPSAISTCGIVLTLCAISYQIARNQWVQFPRAMTGLGCLLVALGPWRGQTLTQIAQLGKYGYGIYLSHVIVVEVMHAILHYTRVPPSMFVDFGTFVISFLIAIAIAKTLARSPKVAWLNG